MGLALKKPKSYTPAEYLELERKAEVRHEYIDGEIFEMAGANKRHNRILVNVVRLLDNQLLERDCNVYESDMRVKITSTEKYTYPDVVASCGEEIFEDSTEDTLLNPMLIIEILSKSTEAYDRGAKFEYYQTIESFQEYVCKSFCFKLSGLFLYAPIIVFKSLLKPASQAGWPAYNSIYNLDLYNSTIGSQSRLHST